MCILCYCKHFRYIWFVFFRCVFFRGVCSTITVAIFHNHNLRFSLLPVQSAQWLLTACYSFEGPINALILLLAETQSSCFNQWWPTMDSAARIFQLRKYWTDFD